MIRNMRCGLMEDVLRSLHVCKQYGREHIESVSIIIVKTCRKICRKNVVDDALGDCRQDLSANAEKLWVNISDRIRRIVGKTYRENAGSCGSKVRSCV